MSSDARGGGRVTLAQVARRAGASHSAASRVLNGRPGVKADIRAAVLAAAEELKYVPNTSARNLVMQRTGLVALVFSDPGIVVGTDFFSDLVAVVVDTLDEADLRTVLLLPEAGGRRPLGDVVRPRSFDGAIIVGHHAGDGVAEVFLRNQIPTVALGRPLDDLHISFVDMDNVAAAATATTHLLSSGASRPALLATAPEASWGVDRVAGFRLAAQAAGIPEDAALVELCEFTSDGGFAGVLSLLEREPALDALLVSSEGLLLGALTALQGAGRRIPADIRVACFDDGPRHRFHDPPITAVRQPLRKVGAELTRLVLDAMAEPTARSAVILPAELVVRGSSR